MGSKFGVPKECTDAVDDIAVIDLKNFVTDTNFTASELGAARKGINNLIELVCCFVRKS